METHFSILAWSIPQIEEAGGLQTMGLHSWTQPSDWTSHAPYISYPDPGWFETDLTSLRLWCTCAQLSSIWLSAAPWIVARQGSSVHGILQARILERVARPSSRGSSQVFTMTGERARTGPWRMTTRCPPPPITVETILDQRTAIQSSWIHHWTHHCGQQVHD